MNERHHMENSGRDQRVISAVVLYTVFLQRELDNLPIQVEVIGARNTGCSLYNSAQALDLLVFTSMFAK